MINKIIIGVVGGIAVTISYFLGKNSSTKNEETTVGFNDNPSEAIIIKKKAKDHIKSCVEEKQKKESTAKEFLKSGAIKKLAELIERNSLLRTSFKLYDKDMTRWCIENKAAVFLTADSKSKTVYSELDKADVIMCYFGGTRTFYIGVVEDPTIKPLEDGLFSCIENVQWTQLPHEILTYNDYPINRCGFAKYNGKTQLLEKLLRFYN